jgi:hypothetical protein
MKLLRSPLPAAATGVVLLCFGVGVASALAPRQEAPFPHEDHAGLFPVCAGCHQGVENGDVEAMYPAPSQCAGCHDGSDLRRVTWAGPSDRVSNVRFAHGDHALELSAAGDPVTSCVSCHADASVGRMAVTDATQLETCWGCHAHQRDDHFADTPAAECASCHVPLAESRFPIERIAALSAPADHDDPDFLASSHGVAVAGDGEGGTRGVDAAARCATCHTSDRCVACHVDPGLTEIGAIPAAPVDMDQPEWASAYPTPASHETISFQATHAPEGSSGTAECATCHTSNDCLSCHVEPAPGPVETLLSRSESRAPGVHLEVTPPETHASAFFLSSHSNLAAADPGTCAACHTDTYCAQCHDGPADGGYHPTSFVSQHAADAWGRSSECASCHSTAAFCRECHQESGLVSQGRLEAGYHDAEPLWLLRHGGAARQSLESCASCHQQNDCVQCHGVLGAHRITPHTADFDAEAAWAQSPRTCIACHTSNPLGGGG